MSVGSLDADGGKATADTPPAATPLQLVSELRRAFHRLEIRLDATLVASRLTYAQFEILFALYEEPKRYAADLARELGLRRQTVHETVGVLVRDGLLEKLERDGGTRGIMLTPDGRSLLFDAEEPLRDFLAVVNQLERTNAGIRDRLTADLRALSGTLEPPRPSWWLD